MIIGEKVTRIPSSVFCGCSSLTSIVIPEGVISIGERAFCGCSSLTSVVIPEGVPSIDHYAFDGCSSLTSVVIPEGVTLIASGAFYGCYSLTSVEIPESVTSIGAQAFAECSKLTVLTLPASLEKIDCRAFGDADSTNNISELYSMAIEPPSISGYEDYFLAPTIYNATLYVPEEAYELYKNSKGWSRFDKIIAINSERPEDPENPDPDDKTNIVLAVINPDYGTVRYQYPLGYESKFSVVPTSGWTIEAVIFNGETITPDENGFYSTGEMNKDCELEIVYSQIITGIEEIESNLNAVKVYCRNGEVWIDGLPENEPVTVHSDKGILLFNGYADRIPVDKSNGVILVQIGTKVFKLAVP